MKTALDYLMERAQSQHALESGDTTGTLKGIGYALLAIAEALRQIADAANKK